MINYLVVLLESDAAKRRVAELFESPTAGCTDYQLTEIVPRGPGPAARDYLGSMSFANGWRFSTAMAQSHSSLAKSSMA
jgi:hypothetical protein